MTTPRTLTIAVIAAFAAIGLAFLGLPAVSAEGALELKSPGLAPSSLEAAGRLVEDWGALQLSLDGVALGDLKLEEIRLEGIVPAVRGSARKGSLGVELTAYRAPAYPAGVDVLGVRIVEMDGKEVQAVLSVGLPEGSRLGEKTASLGGRMVVALPPRARSEEKLREWGYRDEAASLVGWATPAKPCDPAFRNIRAGLGGVPIIYSFTVEPGSGANVVLGFSESHWNQAGERPMIARVEGAPAQEVDPVARWGRHMPGVILFAARDANRDGRLEVAVLPKPGAPDQNPILNVLWIFPSEAPIDLASVVAGKLNDSALRYVDVGGDKDQSVYPPGKIEYSVKLAARGSETLEFLVACPGGTVPLPERTGWTTESLLAAAKAVWTDWKLR